MSGDYTLEGLSVPESLDQLHDLLQQVAEEHQGVASTDLMLFETAVIEIAGNVVEHGRPQGTVAWTFTLAVLPDRLAAVLSDDGQEYALAEDQLADGRWAMPEDDLAEGGRGLALASVALDELDYQRTGGINSWTMVRHRREDTAQ
ncbi:ATP-binding protein [uncultured Serinicoccus sp.]|uniref:ATP-binding protein n=1 Tax=uncultured Serinicoccus sp. TaxID=735514 RepID=UPI002620E90A|nr:ATP-binding protein [uncultured Serinicoccus sp.]